MLTWSVGPSCFHDFVEQAAEAFQALINILRSLGTTDSGT